MKHLKPGQLCTINKLKYKVIKSESDRKCLSCSFYKNNWCNNKYILCIHTIDDSCCFKQIK